MYKLNQRIFQRCFLSNNFKRTIAFKAHFTTTPKNDSISSHSPPKDLNANHYPKFPVKITSNFWTDVHNQKKFAEWLGQQLNHKSMEDWYNVSIQDISNHGGSTLLYNYNYSIYKMLTTVFPEYNWLPWRFSSIPKGYWKDPSTHRLFLDWLGNKLGYKQQSDWYKVTLNDIKDNGGHSLLKQYNFSLTETLTEVYKDLEWLPWLFEQTTRGNWDDIANQKAYMNWLAKKLGMNTMEDLYNLQNRHLQQNGGSTLLKLHGHSVYKLLCAIYPNYNWLPWKFANVPIKFWTEIENRKQYLKWFETQMDIKKPEDWYKIAVFHLEGQGGRALLNHYNNLADMVISLFPEYNLKPNLFDRVPSGYWKNDNNIQDSLTRIERKLNIQNPQEWYNVSRKQIYEVGEKISWHSCEALAEVLTARYNYNFDPSLFKSFTKGQYHLRKVVTTLFPEEDILDDYLHPDLKYEHGESMQLDIYLPALKLALEYQGAQHYQEITMFKPLKIQKDYDQQKVDKCIQQGITLVLVPFWWNLQRESLASSINQTRPDLLTAFNTCDPIPAKPKPDIRTENDYLQRNPEEAAIARKFMLATEWSKTTDPTGWFVSEKYDGIRALWDGINLYSRLGKPIKPPKSFYENFPNVALDGELWTGRGLYHQTCGITLSSKEEKWSKIKFCVFDLPDMDAPYKDRLNKLRTLDLPNNIIRVDSTVCTDSESLKKQLKEITTKGGEGLILRDPLSLYKQGRSGGLRRLKLYEDLEVKYVKRNNGLIGFVCEMPDGALIVVACSPYNFSHPPREGSVITVSYSGFTKTGKPKNPVYLRERVDMTWNDVLKKSNEKLV